MTGRRVLVADDDEITRRVLATVLDLEAFEVTLVEDGDAALSALLQAPPDVAVLDHRMPGRTGLEVLAALRADERTATLPVVLLSGVERAELPGDPIESGASAFVGKPFSPLHLIEVLEQVMDDRSR